MYERPFAIEQLALTAELAARVNNHFSLEVYGVAHGHTAAQLDEIIPGYEKLGLPATTKQEDQNAARAITETLRPTDLVLRENYGHEQPMGPPLPFVPLPDPNLPPAENAQRIAQRQEITDIKAQFDDSRDEFDAIDYAVTHAMLNGVPAMYADCNAAELARHKATGTTLSAEVDNLRVLTALHTMVTIALGSLPPEDAPVPSPQDRRRLVLLFGTDHTEDFKKNIAAGNLPITVDVQPPTPQAPEKVPLDQKTAMEIGAALMAIGNTITTTMAAS